MATKYAPPFADKDNPADWRVEALNEDTGEVRITLFVGKEAEQLAVEYHAFKTGKLPVAKPAPEPKAAPVVAPITRLSSLETMTVTLKTGDELTFIPAHMTWSCDMKRNRLVAYPKPVLELLKKGSK